MVMQSDRRGNIEDCPSIDNDVIATCCGGYFRGKIVATVN